MACSKALLFVLLALLVAPVARAELHVELITVEPGAALWERFGHTAVRAYDGQRDVVFSYGAAPFFDPAFLWKFARGEGEFLVVSESYSVTLDRYRNANRTLMQQELLLSATQKLELVLRLQNAATPPRNRYLYDQLYDNCATRVRDLIDHVSRGALSRAASRRKPNHSYREDTLAAMAGHPVGHWALDLIGGRQQDLKVTSFHEMYLPALLRDRVAEARLTAAVDSGPLAAPARIVFARRGALPTNLYDARVCMLSLTCVLLACAVLSRISRRPLWRWLAAFALCLHALWSGLFGALVVPLSLLSHVHNFSPNENVLLFWPTDIALLPALWRVGFRAQTPGLLLRAYLALKLLALLSLLALKATGLCTQHNVVFLLLASGFLLHAGQALWRARQPG